VYINGLFKISSEGRWETWMEFCLNGTIHQANDAIIRCVKLRDLKDDMAKRTHQSGTPRTARIISSLFSNPIVRVSSLRRTLGVSYPTAQTDIDRLVTAKILSPLAEMRPKCYYAPEIFAIAYAEQDSGIENAEVAA
jgi:Fic family protein